MKLFNKWNLGIWRFAGKEKSRYPLQGIRLTARHSVATDGRRLVVIDTPNDNPEDFPVVPGFEIKKNGRPFLLGSDGAKSLEKKIPNPSKCKYKPILQNVAMVSKGSSAMFAATDLETHVALKYRTMQGKFPDWKRVIPKGDVQVSLQMDGTKLAEVLTYLQRFSDDRSVQLDIRGPLDPVEITATNPDTDQKAFALVMPMDPKGGR